MKTLKKLLSETFENYYFSQLNTPTKNSMLLALKKAAKELQAVYQLDEHGLLDAEIQDIQFRINKLRDVIQNNNKEINLTQDASRTR
jgi:hypothetical protein